MGSIGYARYAGMGHVQPGACLAVFVWFVSMSGSSCWLGFRCWNVMAGPSFP